MKIGIRESMTRGETLPERIAWCTSVGIEGIELHAGSMQLPAAEVIAAFAGSGVGVTAIEGVPRLIDTEPATREAAKVTIRERLALAKDLGAVGVLVVPQFGRVSLPDLTPYKSGAELERDLFVTQLAELAPDAEVAGVSLFIEPLNRYEAYLVNRVGTGAEIGREVSPVIGVMADFFHMNIEEADIPAAITDNADRLVYVHVADNTRRQPGTGGLDLRPGFRALKAIGYEGWLTIECGVDGEYDAAIRATVKYIRTEWDAS